MDLGSFGITYVGVRTGHINELKQFAEEILGYRKTHDEGDFVAFSTPQGQRFELFSKDTPDKQHYPLDGAVPGFEVPDFDKALTWLKANNYKLIKDGLGEGKNARWVHFIGPDDNAYEFVHHKKLLTNGKVD